ncbi:PH domain-containing protein [Streptomyces hokutonensis]|uniref:PH domain-containing protein n=1 Tax=Streptomyces hokutonensis TaxID=1306990 RepID=UPI00036E2283|nr:PH domain-containing protein [Streptomyces hokutonensis]
MVLERIAPWWDRQVLVGICVAAVVAAAVASLRSLSEVRVWQVSLIVSLLCVMLWVARTQLVPSASVSASVLVVRNVYSTYEIPWQTLTGIDWEPRSGLLSLELADGRRVPVQAFSRWPSFGRHRKVIETLEEGRRLAAGPAEDEVRVTGASGITEFLLALCFGAALVALLIEGVIALL